MFKVKTLRISLLLGASVGVLLGLILDNLAVGIGLGAGVGLLLGFILARK
ncbi:hypothetical protein ACFLYB_05230 [Chloroflexota bacterium]